MLKRPIPADEVLSFMRQFRLSLDDLHEVGGQDLGAKDPKVVEKARRVERAWAMMARLGVIHADLERRQIELDGRKN